MGLSMKTLLLSATAALMYTSVTDAHVHISPAYSEPGLAYSGGFSVPHGCNGSATTALTVNVDSSVTDFKPQEISNWTLSINYQDTTNKTINNVTWSGGYLEANATLLFPVNFTTPKVDLTNKQNETIYFPTIQNCVVGTNEWTLTGTESASTDPKAEAAPALAIVKNITEAMNPSSSTTGGSSSSSSAANSIYAGMLPLVATISAVILSL
ncbi:hypothetical protein K501DRAFT_259204 [Backusella circina FSU 941]|nr:hypothetical protein K501DRAFT_259204 [Backusella circina FSU 941]